MKILQIAPYFIPYPGGQERYVYYLSKYLVKMNHDVHVITSNFPNTTQFEIIDGISVERYSPIARPLRNPIALQFLEIRKRLDEFDIIHIHNEHAFSSIVTAFAKNTDNFPLILTNHGRLIFGNIFADTIEKYYMRTFGKKVIKSSDIVVVNSNSDKEYLISIDTEVGKKIKILHNAIDPEILLKYLESPKKIDFNNFEGNFIVLFVGVLVKRKGIEWLIKSIKNIKLHDNFNIKCVVVGEGPDRKFFENLVKHYNLVDVFLFTGRISDEELAWVYSNSSVFVLPSLSEGCPTTIMEAMYYGLPVITTKIPGNIDHFSENAILVPPKDEISLSKAITQFLKDDEKIKSFSSTNKKFIEDKYTWEQLSKEYNEIYKNLLKNRGINR